MKLDAITGKNYGKLSVISYAGKSYWNCKCACGAEKKVLATNLKRGLTSSCGCLARELNTKHGFCGTRVYKIWENMKSRCLNPSNTYWHRYGGRGIGLCNEWLEFEQFYADMGEPPSLKHTLGRIDNNSGYSSQNCRWETKEQQDNNKVLNHFVEIGGVRKTLTQWGRLNGINPSTVLSRISYGWSEFDAVTKPTQRGIKYENTQTH